MKNLRHQRFGRLFVLRKAMTDKGAPQRWLCACDCGSLRRVRGTSLYLGYTKSCGCISVEKSTTHGMSATREYKTWGLMVSRCHCETDDSYERYGGRGIVVCERWRHSFENFYKDMGEKPDGLTLERVDNNGPYSPENCVWADYSAQNNNKRTNVILTHQGESLTLAQWSERTGIPYRTLHARTQVLGWTAKRALETPVRKAA